MIRSIGLGSLAVVALALVASAMAQQEGGKRKRPPPRQAKDPWAAEKADPKFADVDWTYNQDMPIPPGGEVMGEPLYKRFCIQCHGETGGGDGVLAPFLVPPPRNFTKGIFKGRSSHPELPPCATDVMRSLVHGLPISGMLSYSFLTSLDQQNLVAYVKVLAGDLFKKGFGYPLKSGNFHRALRMPLPTAEALARGRALFDRLSCEACHGPEGDGKGRVAATLSDTGDGRPSHVRDFTQGIFSGGPNVRHIYLRITGGVQGTVMPPFATSAPVEDRWALAHFVTSLSKVAEKRPLPHHEKLYVNKVAALPKNPADPGWDVVPKEDPPPEMSPEGYPFNPVFNLHLYLQQPRVDPARPYFTPATVQGLHDGKSIALRVTWSDATGDQKDRFEIQLSPETKYGFVIYGSEVDPVNVWRWDSSAPAAAQELDAEGPFSVKAQASSDVTAVSSYDAAKKQWSVMFTRALAGTAGKDAPLPVGVDIPILFMMRDGADQWPDSHRPIPVDPDADPASAALAKEEEARRAGAEAEAKDKFKDLPRHLTTWHRMVLKD